MKTAGKSVLKVLLSFTVAISCLIGISMTSVADENELYVGQVIKYEETLSADEGVGYYIGEGSTHFFHTGVIYTVAKLQDNKNAMYYGFRYTYNGADYETIISTAPVTDGSTGIKIVKGDGKSGTPFEFKTYNPETEEADKVIDMIEALPDPDDVIAVPACEEPIEQARAAYDKLEEALQVRVGEENIAKLEACEKALEAAKADKAVADVVQALVDALPEPEDVTEDDRADIEAAREAFTKLTDSQKIYMNINKLIDDEIQIDKNKAAEVIDLIDAIGEVDISDECGERIKAARIAYNALTTDQSRFVDNFNDMTAAEEKYLGLKREEAIKEVTDKINALPSADKLTIEDFYEVYEAEYFFFNHLTEEEQAAFDPALKKKLDEVMNTEYLIFLEAGKQLVDEYKDVFSELECSPWIDNAYKERLQEAEAIVSAGKTPDAEQFDNLIWDVIAASSYLFDYYEIVEGEGAVWPEGSTEPIVFRIRQAGLKAKMFDKTYLRFDLAGRMVYVDGVLVDSKYFTAEEGSVVITIKPEFLKTLSTGEHTLTVIFSSISSTEPISVTTKFTVKAAAAVPSSGESVSHYVILGISVVLLAGAVLTLRKHMVDSVK